MAADGCSLLSEVGRAAQQWRQQVGEPSFGPILTLPCWSKRSYFLAYGFGQCGDSDTDLHPGTYEPELIWKVGAGDALFGYALVVCWDAGCKWQALTFCQFVSDLVSYDAVAT